MPRIIELPDGRTVEVPDNVPLEEVEKALRQQYTPLQSTAPAPQPAAPAPQPQKPLDWKQAVEGYTGSYLQGATFGWLDEIAAGIRSIISDKPYNQILQEERQRLDALQQRLPGTKATELAGAIASPVNALLPGASAGASLPARMGLSALQGGAMGALAGLGAGGEGQKASTGALSGLAGAAIGAAGPPFFRTIGTAGSYLTDLLNLRGLLSKTGAVASPEKRAMNVINDYLAMDRTTAGEAARKIQEAREIGRPFTVADTAGENVRNLADAVLSQPSAGAGKYIDLLAKRSKEEGSRLADTVRNLGAGVQSYAHRKIEYNLLRAQQLQPAYEQFLDSWSKTKIDTPKIVKLLHRPIGRTLWSRAQQMAANEGRKLPEVYGPNGEVTGVAPDLRSIDYMRKALRDMIYVGKRTGSSGKEERHIMMQYEKELLDEVDNLVPGYRDVREAYSKELAVLDSVKKGESLANQIHNYQDLALAIDEHEPSLVPYLIEGIKSGLAKRMEAMDRGIPSRLLAGGPAKEASLRRIYGSDYPDLAQAIEAEQAMRRTGATVLGNSRTAKRLSHQEALGIDSPLAYATKYGLIERMFRNFQQPMIRRNADLLADLMLDPDTALSTARKMESLRRTMEEANKRIQYRYGRTGAALGLLFGGND